MTYIFDTMEENCKRTRTKNLLPQMISCFPQQCCWTLSQWRPLLSLVEDYHDGPPIPFFLLRPEPPDLVSGGVYLVFEGLFLVLGVRL